jgi:o-succinylbenzoate---CoA ligase
MGDWLAARVRASPDATAVIDTGSGECLSYEDLDERADRLAAGLRKGGIEAGDHVGVVLGVGSATVATVHAVMRCGAVLVPLSPRLTTGELAIRAKRADCSVLVHDGGTEPTARAVDTVPVLPIDVVRDSGSELSNDPNSIGQGAHTGSIGAASEHAGGTWNGADRLAVVFTSGTTGRPKGVVLTAGNVLASAGASATRLGILPSDRWLLALSVGGMGGLAPIYRSVLYGSALVIEREFEAARTAEHLNQFECTGISLVPTMLDRMLAGESRTGESDGKGGEPVVPESLRFVLLGGAPASRELIERCRRRGVPVYPTYGMTETASQVATARPEEAVSYPGTVGRPLFGVEVNAVANGEILDAGERGELVVSGPIVTPGYYASEAGVFSEHGFHTGDVGYLDTTNRIWVTGRLDDRIVTGGETVDPEEVRQVLGDHPQVVDAAVVGLADPEWGQRVGALVVGDTGREAIEAHCRERLAGYKLPRTVAFAATLPRTQSGTIDREAVAACLRERADG